jgi:hypothetical protein
VVGVLCSEGWVREGSFKGLCIPYRIVLRAERGMLGLPTRTQSCMSVFGTMVGGIADGVDSDAQPLMRKTA